MNHPRPRQAPSLSPALISQLRARDQRLRIAALVHDVAVDAIAPGRQRRQLEIERGGRADAPPDARARTRRAPARGSETCASACRGPASARCSASARCRAAAASADRRSPASAGDGRPRRAPSRSSRTDGTGPTRHRRSASAFHHARPPATATTTITAPIVIAIQARRRRAAIRRVARRHDALAHRGADERQQADREKHAEPGEHDAKAPRHLALRGRQRHHGDDRRALPLAVHRSRRPRERRSAP